VTKKNGKDVPGLAAVLLAWLENEDLTASPNVDFDEFIGLIACHQHRKDLTAAIAALEKSRVSISDSTACMDSSSENDADFNENPSKMGQETPVKTRTNFAVSRNSTQDSKYKVTPTRPALTALQYNQTFAEPESSDSKHSYDSSFWDTPGSTFSEDPLEQLTPETPHSEWLPPRRRHQYFEPPKSPTMTRGARRRGRVDDRTQFEEDQAQSDQDADPVLAKKSDDDVIGGLVRRQLFRDENVKANLGPELKKEDVLSVAYHQKDGFKTLATKRGDDRDATKSETDVVITEKFDLPVECGVSDAPIYPGPSRGISPGASLGSIHLELYKEDPSAVEIIKVLEKKIGKRDSQMGRVYIIHHHDYVSQDPMDDRQLFKVGFTTNTTEERYRNDACKEIQKSGTIIFQSEKPFEHAFRVESLVHAALAKERMRVVNCPTCNSTHIEWFLSTEERVRKEVEQWTALVQNDAIYVRGKLIKEVKDFLHQKYDPAGLACSINAFLETQKLHTNGNEENPHAINNTTLFLNTTVESMGVREFKPAGKPGTLQWTAIESNLADSMATKPESQSLKIGNKHNSLSQSFHPQKQEKCASVETMNAVQNAELNNERIGKDETSASGWNMVVNLLKGKTGLKTLKEALKLPASTPASSETLVSVETRKESKSALVRRKTGELFKSR
jgi:hypothetical protein